VWDPDFLPWAVISAGDREDGFDVTTSGRSPSVPVLASAGRILRCWGMAFKRASMASAAGSSFVEASKRVCQIPASFW
jgi:hypothetical protein